MPGLETTRGRRGQATRTKGGFVHVLQTQRARCSRPQKAEFAPYKRGDPSSIIPHHLGEGPGALRTHHRRRVGNTAQSHKSPVAESTRTRAVECFVRDRLRTIRAFLHGTTRHTHTLQYAPLRLSPASLLYGHATTHRLCAWQQKRAPSTRHAGAAAASAIELWLRTLHSPLTRLVACVFLGPDTVGAPPGRQR